MDWAADIITAFVTAGIGFLLGWRGFILRERFKEKVNKRDKLREFLSDTVPTMLAFIKQEGITELDEIMPNFDERRTQAALSLRKEAEACVPFFPSNESVQSAMKRMGEFMVNCANNETFAEDFTMFREDRELLEARLRDFESEVTGDGQPPFWKIWKR